MVKNLPAMQETPGSIPGSGRFPGEGKHNGQRSLAGYSLQGRKESDMTERLTLSNKREFETRGSRIQGTPMTPEEPTLASALALGHLRSPLQEKKDQNPEMGHQLSRGKAWEMTTDFHV